MNSFTRRLTLLMFVVLAGACGTQNSGGSNQNHDLPMDAFGRASDPLPEGAIVVDADTFNQHVAAGATLVSAHQAQVDGAAADLDASDNQRTVDELKARRPDLADLLTGQPDPSDSSVRPTGDGNYSHIFTDKLGNTRHVITMGQTAKNERLAEALRRFPTYDNQDHVYRQFYSNIVSRLSEVQRRELGLLQIPNPSQPDYQSHDVSSLIALNQLISSRWEAIRGLVSFDPNVPHGYPSSCANEEGAGHGSDRSGYGTSCENHTAKGAYANFNWPTKYYATCVKDQGNRGTCGAFGILGALESGVALKYQRWVNLSEQDLYNHVKMTWWPSHYGDGINTHGVWQKMLEKNYLVPFESQWDYNPSPSRTSDDVTQTYHHSCDGYSEACSDTNHQGQLYCMTYNEFRYCYYTSPPNPMNSGFRAAAETEVWDFNNLDRSMAMTLLAVIFQSPLVISLDVVPTFDNPDADGYVRYLNPDGKSRGGHILEVTGFVGNSDLHARFPHNPPPDGSGGGYLIIKNSWGLCWGDAGYVYLPLDWVRAHTWSMTILGGVQ